MTLPDQTPKLSKLPFLLADAALLVTAWLVAHYSRDPFVGTPLIVIVGCVFAAALLGAIPFLADYARKQDEALDDRQRSLEALARIVTTSAEQISIATNGLNEIAELTQKALRHADHLPQKLQEKITDFQSQLTNASEADREELEREVAALRTSESDRLETLSDKIAKSAAEWTKLEAATQKHFAAITTALDEKLAALDAKIAALGVAAAAVSVASATPPPPAAVSSPATEPSESTAPATAESPTAPAHPPKRPRKPRREEAETPAVEPAQAPESETPKVEEPTPVPAEKIPEVAPVAPHTAEPFAPPPAAVTASETAPSADVPAAETPKPSRKRAPKKPAPAEGEPSLGLVEPPQAPPAAEMVERIVSTDGATRLLVTAYIGIGNRLFIRGDGPGLSWEKGVPLQFVSIGKWRWETNTATAPVKFKLYKNDEVECAALGAQSLDPGHQQEVTAAF